MPKKTPNITSALKELTKPQLLQLATKKKAKIPKSWTKTNIIQTLATITKPKDLKPKQQKPKTTPPKNKTVPKTKNLKQKIQTTTKPKKTLKKKTKKNSLEDRVTKIFTRKGYQCTKNIQTEGININILGTKKGNIFTDNKHLIIECKEKPKVTPEDLKTFLANTILYLRRKNINPDHVQAIIYTTGQIEKEVRTQAKKFPIIKLERLKPLQKPQTKPQKKPNRKKTK